MREQFPWFLDPTEEELQRLWEEATFSFDANVILNLYRVDRETTQDYFKIFRAFGNRIFLPHEAANQFFHNRRGVIRTEQNSFSEAKEKVEEWVERRKVFNDIKDHLRGGDIGQIIEDEIESVFEGREGYDEEIAAVKDDLIARIEDLEERFTPTGTTRANAEEDEILEGLMGIFEGKTGEALDGDIEDLKDKALERYESQKPPGYEDYDEDDDLTRGECEDFLIWRQLIEFAEQEGEDVVFITDDGKFDWWEKNDDYDFVRPRHELLREFSKETDQSFWMLTTERMLDSAYERLGVEVRDKSVEQTETVGKGDTKTEKSTGRLASGEDEAPEESYGDRLARSRALKDFHEIIKDEIDKINRKIEILENNNVPNGGLDELIYKVLINMKKEIPNKVIGASKQSDVVEEQYARKEITNLTNELSSAARSKDRETTKNCLHDLKRYLKIVANALRSEAEKVRP